MTERKKTEKKNLFEKKKKNSNIPNNLLTKGCTLNGSKSSVCSPVPMKITGLLVAATLAIENRKQFLSK